MGQILYEMVRAVLLCVKMLVLYWGILNGNLVKERWKYLYAAGGIALGISGFVLSAGEVDVKYSFLVSITICMLLTKDKVKGRIVGCFVCYIMVNNIDSIPAAIEIALGENFFADRQLYKLLINIGLLFNYLFLSVIWHSRCSEQKFVFQRIKWKTILLFVLEFISCAVIIGGIQLFLIYENITEIREREKIFIGILASSGCMIMLLGSIFQLIISASRDEYKELLENKEEYFQMNYHYYTEMHRFRHDMIKHLNCIYYFCNSGNVEKSMNYIKGINEDIDGVSRIIDCGNETISAVVNNIYERVKEKDVDFRCEGHVINTDIKDVDLCTVFSNVLENAYEACLKVEDKRMIHITFGMKECHIYMYMENSTAETEIKRNQRLFTRKEGMHGIGMKNICEVIERYEGMISWYAKDGIFVTEILM